jgi:diaminopimelate epimerase
MEAFPSSGQNMKLHFYKMQATGNDFVVIDNRTKLLSLDTIIAITPMLCDRRFGIGADGILILETSSSHDFTMIYRNADGSDAGMCGNGGRAMCLFASRLGLGESLHFQVHNTSYSATVTDSFVSLSFDDLMCKVEEIPTDHRMIYKVFSGTDHVVIRSDLNSLNDLETLRHEGSTLRHDSLFAPRGTNVNFSCLSDDKILLRTYERGVENLTLACGTGSIATAIVEHYVGSDKDKSENIHQKVESIGGTLDVRFSYDSANDIYKAISLQGAVNMVFEGEIEINL